MSAAALASMAGCILAGPAADAIGRKPVLIINSLIMAAGYTILGLATNAHVLVLGRVLTGIAAGVAGVTAPIYIAEVSPAHLRGQLGSFFNGGICIGLILVSLLNYLELSWRAMGYIGGNAVPAIGFVAMFFFPESPAWLATAHMKATDSKKSDLHERLSDSLRWLHGDSTTPMILEADTMIERLQAEVESGVGSKNRSALSLLFSYEYRWAALLGVGVASSFAATAVNCVNAYTGTILEIAEIEWVPLAIVIYSIVQFVVSFFGGFIAENYNRKTFLTLSAVGCAVSHVIIAIGLTDWGHKDLALAGTFLFIGSIAVGLGPLHWVYAAEILPGPIRGVGFAVANVIFWFVSWLQEHFLFQLMGAITQPGAFLFFAGCNALIAIFCAAFLVETRGLSLDQIEKLVVRTKA
jgi:MFS family permease